ncbi:LuxR C-terminal-related transcriptional regulator [Nitrosomonas ureae]|uniref:Two component transcriptional regulator, LuxR family n=1 Tax=Nitrosomonas ureae TaxID=44577 RepID=A0A1H5RKN1_9PROT|nr:response regulator transcription factor [Nitrosomonas ureae]SEF38644.1 two component transcriptional regulator, LuxR family [Nitrosomonas ureae]
MFTEAIQNLLPNNRIKVLLIDPHPIVLFGLSVILEEEDTLEIVDMLHSVACIQDVSKLNNPDIVLIDPHSPSVDGLNQVKQVQAALGSETKIVVYTTAVDQSETCDLIRMGVKGILLKEMSVSLIPQCLKKVHAGGEWLDRRSVRMAFEQILQRESAHQKVSAHLSSREMSLAALIAKGYSSKLAARELQITEGSVRVYLNRIYSKLHISSRLQLALLFKEKGLD